MSIIIQSFKEIGVKASKHKPLITPSLPECMQCFAFLSAKTNSSFFGVGLLNCPLLKDLRTNLRFSGMFFFSYTLVYDTMSINFDFVRIWRSTDEYIESEPPPPHPPPHKGGGRGQCSLTASAWQFQLQYCYHCHFLISVKMHVARTPS